MVNSGRVSEVLLPEMKCYHQQYLYRMASAGEPMYEVGMSPPRFVEMVSKNGTISRMAETRLRLPDETYEQIKQIASGDAQSVNSTMIVAIEEYIARRRRERYEAMGRKIAQRDRELLDRLAR